MYPLFWKIFLTFWLTVLVIEVFTAWISADLSEYEIHPILEKQNSDFVASSTMAVSILTKEGLSGLQGWLELQHNYKAIDDIYIFNKYHMEINNKPLTGNVQAILQNYINTNTPITHYQPLKNTLSFKTVTPDGDDYLLISTFEHPHPVKYLLAPQRVVMGIILSGFICFVLARYFTLPLEKLRETTKSLSQGEFNTTELEELRNRGDEFGALATDFKTMSIRLSDLIESQKQLLRDISHELRSPLTRLQVALGLARKNTSIQISEDLNRIESEAEHLESLIQELLIFTRIEASNKLESKVRTNLNLILEQIVNDVHYEQQTKKPLQIIHLQCSMEINILSDAQLLHRALENVIRNACYYSPNETTIIITGTENDETVLISIEDSGPGVPEEMLEKIFKPFVRVSTARESDTGGSGIGLAIAKKVIKLHGGTITAENVVPDKSKTTGLIVSITLPN